LATARVFYAFAQGFLDPVGSSLWASQTGPVTAYPNPDDDEPDWVDGLAPDSLEVVSIPDAAAELGLSVPDLVERLVWEGLLIRHPNGLLIKHPNGGYIPSVHPDLVPVGAAIPQTPSHPFVMAARQRDAADAKAQGRSAPSAQTHRTRMDTDPVYRLLVEMKERAGNTLDAVNDGSLQQDWETANANYELARDILADYRKRLDDEEPDGAA